jgi:hypothetical protein
MCELPEITPIPIPKAKDAAGWMRVVSKVKHSRWTMLVPLALVFVGSFQGSLVRALCLSLAVLIATWIFYDTELAKDKPAQRKWRTSEAFIVFVVLAVLIFWSSNILERLTQKTPQAQLPLPASLGAPQPPALTEAELRDFLSKCKNIGITGSLYGKSTFNRVKTDGFQCGIFAPGPENSFTDVETIAPKATKANDFKPPIPAIKVDKGAGNVEIKRANVGGGWGGIDGSGAKNLKVEDSKVAKPTPKEKPNN